MDLVQLVQDLSSKVDAFANPHVSVSRADLFRLREEIRAGARRIAYAIDGPDQAMRAITRGYTSCTALKICVDLGLAQHLPPSGTRSVEHLASATGCDLRVIRVLLRLLAQHGIFRQLDDGRWGHTEMSQEMTKAPFRAWMTSILEEKYRATAYLPRFLKETGYRFPSSGNTAFNAVYETPLDFYTYSNEFDPVAALNFAVSMQELARTQLPFLEKSYPFDRVDSRSHFVDVAGGLGNLAYFLAGKLPDATFVVQDHPFIVREARRACPAALAQRITFEAQDMLSPQQPTKPEHRGKVVFVLKIILHDHVDADCKLILEHLLSVMGPGDRILVIDTVITEAGGSLSACTSDVLILSMSGSGHRTLREFLALIHSCEQNLVVDTFTGGTEEPDGMMVIEIQKCEPTV